MKKISIAFLFLATPVLAHIPVTPGVGKTVATETNGGNEYQAVEIVTPGGASTATVTSGNLNVSQQGNITVNALPAGSNTIGNVNGTGFGSFTVTPGTGTFTTNQSGTYTVTPGTGVFSIGGVYVDSSAFTLATSSGVPILGVYVPNPSFLNQQSTTTAGLRMTTWRSLYVTPMDAAGVILGTSTTNPIKVDNSGVTQPISGSVSGTGFGSFTVTPGTGTFNTSQQGNITINAIPSGGNTIGNVNGTGFGSFTVTPGTGVFSIAQSTFGAVGSAANGTTAAGNPLQMGVKVTSTTIPTATADGNIIYAAGTNIGQVLVTGVPWGVIKTTYSALISSSTNNLAGGAGSESILISSAGSATYTYLCGCVFTNTTATAGNVILESPGGSVTNRFAIGIPASNVPAGVYAGCTNPFYRSNSNSNIYIFQNASTSAAAAVNMYCTYYQGP